MTSNGRIHKYRTATVWHFLLDFLIVVLAFVVGTRIRFDENWLFKLSQYLPGIFAGAIALPIFLYIAGLYSTRLSGRRSPLKTYLLLSLLFVAATAVMLAVFYVNFSTRVGRGVMLVSWPTAAVLLFSHHALILAQDRGRRERIAFLVGEGGNHAELALLSELDKSHFDVIGLLANCRDESHEILGVPYLGNVSQAEMLVAEHRIERLVCSERCLYDTDIRSALCQLRYSGILVCPALSLCEEEFQLAPLELVSTDWLLTASDSPRLIYIKKIKRGFDVSASVACLLLLWPALLVGMLLVKMTSRGPVFYRQTRLGRFGKHFSMLKLRTMRTDAEESGARWSSEGDSRLTAAGRILRKYRIDEIPQLFNVLRGQMSFVGPRPERPEFVEMLNRQIPWYGERLLIQPGLTGWAQVNYPYGSSVQDAVRKLEYDLYYMKHMGLYLDVAILLDTVRTILTGAIHDERQVVDPLKRDFTSYAGSAEAGEVMPTTTRS